MEKQIIDVQDFKQRKDDQGRPIAPLSLAVKAGDFIYVSGLPPIDPETGSLIEGDIKAQTRQSLENIKWVLKAAGSSLDKVVKVTIFCTNVAYFSAINEIYREYFAEDPPARSFVNVGSWPIPFDIEIECVALV